MRELEYFFVVSTCVVQNVAFELCEVYCILLSARYIYTLGRTGNYTCQTILDYSWPLKYADTWIALYRNARSILYMSDL